jgi:error-prone DNA polymerase
MARLFPGREEAVARSVEIVERCRFNLDELGYEYPEEPVPEGQTPPQRLAKLAWQGAAERFPEGVPDKVRGLIEHELHLIERLDYARYFLTVHDIVRFARQRDILCQGRGSAANSVVCYCLGITAVDPARIDVLFERFISAARKPSRPTSMSISSMNGARR